MISENSVVIEIGDRYSRIAQVTPRAWAIIRQVCQAQPDGFRFMPRYKNGTWDGYVCLMQGSKLIPTGLLNMVYDRLEEERIPVLLKLGETSKPPKTHLPAEDSIRDCLNGVTLRDYQISAVLALLKGDRGIAKMATNAGKTVVFAALIKLLEIPRTLVVVQSLDLLYQTSERLAGYLGIQIGVVGDSQHDIQQVTVATIQTLHSMRRRSKYFLTQWAGNKILIVDECHHVAHNQTFDILMDVYGWHRFGMSGTPINRGALNDLKLMACTGPVLVEVTNSQLIAEEWSAQPVIVVSEADGVDSDWDAEYSDAYSRFIVDNPYRNRQVIKSAVNEYSNGRSALIIVSRISHGESLLAMLKEYSLDESRIMFVQGNSPIEDRKRALAILDDGPSIVVSTNIFDEGVDVPHLDSIILACAGKSQIKLLQRIGRGLRRKEGHNTVTIYDFIDSFNKYLLNHSEERVNVYQSEGFQIECQAT